MTPDFRLGALLDFANTSLDLDFSTFEEGGETDGIETEIERRPVLYTAPRVVDFENAMDFCRAVKLEPGARYFSFISGDFIFGDILEGFAEVGYDIRRLTIQTLSISADNVDSLVNLLNTCQQLETVRLVLSTYFFAHEGHPGGIVPYVYREVEPLVDEFDVAFAMIHTKVISFECADGLKVVIDGSANLRSSKSVEQIRVECDGELYDHVEGFADKLFAAYSVINRGRNRPDNTRGGARKLWEAIHE